MREPGGIYVIRHIASRKCYVGSAVAFKSRWKVHRDQLVRGRHHNIHLQRAWDRDGGDAFQFRIVQYVTDMDKLIEREQHWIDHHRSQPHGIYNINPVAGSSRGRPIRPETREKMSHNMRNMSAERRKQIGQAVRNRSAEMRARIRESRGETTEETREKMRLAHLGLTHTDETKAKMSVASRGHSVSEEQREKLRQAKLGKKASDEARAAMSRGQTGRKRSAETNAKIQATRKANGAAQKNGERLAAYNRTRVLSEEARRKIGDGQRRRHAAWLAARAASENQGEAPPGA